MNKLSWISKNILFGALICSATVLPGPGVHNSTARSLMEKWELSPYFNTKFLTQYKWVTRRLKKVDGFVEGFFKNEDNQSINYLYLKRPDARYTILFCAGFLPGRKEGLASYYAMLPDDCNILFFDARAHGKSQGELILWKYGTQEYKDIIAATKFAHNQSNAPIIIHGTCAGAFHAAHAVLEMQRRDLVTILNIKGLIFDSGWGNVKTTAYSSFHENAQSMLLNKCAQLYGAKDKEKVKNRWLYKGASQLLHVTARALHSFVAKPILSIKEYQTKLSGKMSRIAIPTYFIHSTDDMEAPIGPVKQLAAQVKNKQCWWIDKPSRHACHNLKFKQEYKKNLLNFIDTNVGH